MASFECNIYEVKETQSQRETKIYNKGYEQGIKSQQAEITRLTAMVESQAETIALMQNIIDSEKVK